jgi:hypothetical protein
MPVGVELVASPVECVEAPGAWRADTTFLTEDGIVLNTKPDNPLPPNDLAVIREQQAHAEETVPSEI